MGDIHSQLVNKILKRSPTSETFVLSELSKFKAFNYTRRMFLQSFDYSVETLELSVRRYFPPYRILTTSDCSTSGLAQVCAVLNTDDFETVAICLARERGFNYIFTDDEDLGHASKVLPIMQLRSLNELLTEASQ